MRKMQNIQNLRIPALLVMATVGAMIHGPAMAADASAWPPPHMKHLPPDYLKKVREASDPKGFAIDRKTSQIDTTMRLIPAMAHGGYEREASALIEDQSFKFSTFPENGFRLFSTADFRLYGLYNPRTGLARKCLSPKASAKLEAEMWRGTQEAGFGWSLADVTGKDLWSSLGSENSDVCSAVGHLLTARYLKDIPEYAKQKYRDGSTAEQQYKARVARMNRWIDTRVKHGTLFEEYGAQYMKWTIPALLNLYDFCGDPVLQKKAGMFLDLAFAEMAEDTLNGQRGSPKHRNKKDTNRNGTFDRYFTAPKGGFAESTSSYYPPAPIHKLANGADKRGRYTWLRGAPGMNRKDNPYRPPYNFYDKESNLVLNGFSTPNYVMGTHRLDPRSRRTEGRYQRWEGVIFANDPNARIAIDGKNTGYDDYISNVVNSVQDRNIWVCRKWGTFHDKNLDRNPWITFTSTLDEVVEEKGGDANALRDGWVFVKAGKAFAAVKVVSGGYKWILPKKYQEDKNFGRMSRTSPWRQHPFDRDIKCYIRPEQENSPVIIVANDAADYNGSFEAFQAAIKSQPIDVEGETVRFATVTHRGLKAASQINGKDLDYKPALVWDSPFLRSQRGSGVVYFRAGDETIVYDFSNEEKPTVTVDVKPDNRFPPGSGTEEPLVLKPRSK